MDPGKWNVLDVRERLLGGGNLHSHLRAGDEGQVYRRHTSLLCQGSPATEANQWTRGAKIGQCVLSHC